MLIANSAEAERFFSHKAGQFGRPVERSITDPSSHCRDHDAGPDQHQCPSALLRRSSSGERPNRLCQALDVVFPAAVGKLERLQPRQRLEISGQRALGRHLGALDHYRKHGLPRTQR